MPGKDQSEVVVALEEVAEVAEVLGAEVDVGSGA